MSKLNQIMDISDMVGKTISATKQDCNDLWIKFTDDSFAVLEVNDTTEGFGYTRTNVDIYKYKKDNTDTPLLDLGLISHKQYKYACDKKEEEYKQYVERSTEENRLRLEKYELEQLKKLNEKYNKG